MRQRGRKSPEDLLIAATAIPQRPEPPEHLSPEEAEIWRDYVSPMPADWFLSNTRQLLAGLCALGADCRELRRALNRFTDGIPEDGPGFQRYRQLQNMYDSKLLSISTLETKLRLTKQSTNDTHGARAARTAIANAAPGPKPWD
jgi:hypothetical protein